MLRIRSRLVAAGRFYASSLVDYDAIVIGGGSGGLSFSKTAASLGARVALVDAVRPSPIGSSWGLGGTCANVGCIPKKLMHHAAIVGREVGHASKYGWTSVKERGPHDWATLVGVVGDRIKANNWIYRVQLNEKGVKYYNAFASFVDANTIHTVGADKKKTESVLRAPTIVLATGMRPRYPDIPGAHLGISSDDVFSLSRPPGRTLVVGGGYVALETAGLLCDLTYSADLLIRSSPLKAFDKDCVQLVMDNLAAHGVNVIYGNNVDRVEEVDGRKKVWFSDASKSPESYDTIIWAVTREPRLSDLAVNSVPSLLLAPESGRILVDDNERTTHDGIYALGDIAEGRPELAPTAIQAGQLLAERLYNGSDELMRYDKVAVTVFTPLELSTVGLTEQQAVEAHGADNIEVFHSYFTPFEHVIPQDTDSAQCYAKVVCLREKPRRVLGIHIVAPNSVEMMQGYAVAYRMGCTYDDLKATVAIHPCSSEEIVKMSVTKRSGQDPRGKGCCG